jgi:CubicO group peptidase (beta-lactamase class C family)
MVDQPGEHWAYNSASLMLVGEMISKTSNMTIPDFTDKYLFGPLGITNYQWGFSPKERAWLAGNAKMTPRDMAKFGYMILNRGRWGKKRLFLRAGSGNRLKNMLSAVSVGDMDIFGQWERPPLIMNRLNHFGQLAMGVIIFSYSQD